MLENMKDMLEKADNGKYAVPHFNINNLEWTRFILEECENLKTPVIIGVSEVLEDTWADLKPLLIWLRI